MLKKILIGLLLITSSFSFVKADEGMWLLFMLNKNYEQMKAQGFKLTVDDIYNLNKPSMKDAIVSFGGYCTGEIVSSKGLIFTNHHCGYGAIQQHSSEEHNYLENGFWAQSLNEEIPTPGLFVRFLVKIEDYTSKVLEGVDDKDEKSRLEAINKKITELTKALKVQYQKENYDVEIRSFFNSNYFYLMLYETYNDVRFVGAPPSSIGKFGHDTDNWMWPRHTGDFSVFRVYMSPEGKPAEYSDKNVPMKPQHFLPISLKGYNKGDFAFIMGYPGRTDRYLTSFGIEQLLNNDNPNRIKIRGLRQELMLEDMHASEKVNIMYASKYARSSNYWKYSIGQSKGLKKLNVFDKKKAQETAFAEWVSKDKNRLAKYGDALNLYEKAYKGREKFNVALQYYGECLQRGVELISMAIQANALNEALKANNTEKANSLVAALKEYSIEFYKDFNMPTDKKIAKAMFELFANDVAPDLQPEIFATIKSKYNNNFSNFVDDLFKSVFATKESFDQFIKNPSSDIIEKDFAFQTAKSIYTKSSELYSEMESYDYMLIKAKRLYMAGLLEMDSKKLFYPDANSTMRITYGSVGDYSPADAIHYLHYTTLKGVMEKEDPSNWEFNVMPKLKELYKKKDFGQYGVNGEMYVAFTTNNDITGGNSGSPVMNGKGELIGIAFDGNWEAMSGDIAFENDLQKCINVDIRYVLFVIEKVGDCKRLIDEMKIIK